MFAPPVKAPKAKTSSQTDPARARNPLRPAPGVGITEQMLTLQRTIGNQAVLRLLAQRAESLTGSTLAPNLGHPVSVSRPGDSSELEANRLAARLLAGMDQAGSSKGSTDRAPAVVTLQNRREPGQVDAAGVRDRQGARGPTALRTLPQSGGALANWLASRYGNGQPLDETVRRAVEPLLGHDLGPVRTHPYEASEMAGAVAARAFTVGPHIYFDQGEYNPSTRDGMKVLLHELAHTTQPSGEIIQRWPRIASWDFRTSDPRSADNCAPGLPNATSSSVSIAGSMAQVASQTAWSCGQISRATRPV
jgi:hypothetical protein